MATRLGTHIRALRDEKGWSIGQLAARTGLKVPTISKIERGETEEPNLDILVQIATALDIDVHEFFKDLGIAISPGAPVSLKRKIGELLEVPLYSPGADTPTTFIYIPSVGDVGLKREGLRADAVYNAEFVPTVSPNDIIVTVEAPAPIAG